MKVLVTGASGFIGQYVCSELRHRGHLAIAFDRYNRYDTAPDTSFFLGDITDDVSVTEGMAHVDAFIHLAGVLGTQETINNPKPAAYTNILGGLNVFQAAAQYKVPGVNIAVGNYWMNNTYSITKSTMERFAHMYNKERDTNITIVRALNAYGPGQVSAKPYGEGNVKKIMPAFVNAAIRDVNIQIYGDGTQIMDMIYVSDVAQVLVSALEHTCKHGVTQIFEAGSGNKTTVNDIANTVISVANSKSRLVHTDMRPGEPEHSIVLGDPSTLKDLELRPFVDLEAGIQRTVEYFRSNLNDK